MTFSLNALGCPLFLNFVFQYVFFIEIFKIFMDINHYYEYKRGVCSSNVKYAFFIGFLKYVIFFVPVLK